MFKVYLCNFSEINQLLGYVIELTLHIIEVCKNITEGGEHFLLLRINSDIKSKYLT